MAYAGGSKGARLGESAVATLPLLAYLFLACAMMVADHRAGLGREARSQLSVLAEPVWWLAALPSRLAHQLGDGLTLRSELQLDNETLRNALRINAAQLNRLQAAALENRRLRELLGSTSRHRLEVRLAELVDVDLDPYRQRVVIDQGARQGVKVGQPVMDAGGLLGQVIEVSPHRATVLLLTDPEHAVPVQVARSGFRSIAYGDASRIGRPSRLQMPNIPQSADIAKGDVLITSGLGGRFPAGLPVGVVSGLHADATGLFIAAEVTPAAQLDHSTQVLLLEEVLEPVVQELKPAVNDPAVASDPKAVQGKPATGTGNTAVPAAVPVKPAVGERPETGPAR